MNTVSVWLPPDGDARLVRFLEEVVSAAGLPAPSLPVYLELASGPPSGPVVAGLWRLHEGEPVWDASDDRGPVGIFRFSLGVRSWTAEDLRALPAAPRWRWTKGLTARLDLEQPLGDASFVLWSWSSRRGWRSAPPTR